MRKLTTTDSSNVHSISYDSGVDGEYIDVEFVSGLTYRYTGVSQRMFLEACASPSLGKWVNAALVKRPVDDDHKCVKMPRPAEPSGFSSSLENQLAASVSARSASVEELRSVLQLILDHVDYSTTPPNCPITETMVERAKKALAA